VESRSEKNMLALMTATLRMPFGSVEDPILRAATAALLFILRKSMLQKSIILCYEASLIQAMRKIITAVLFLFIPFHGAAGAPVARPDSAVTTGTNIESNNMLFWLTVGGGVIGPGIGGDFKVTYAWGSKSISAKVCAASELSIGSSSNDQVVEYGLYYGAQTYNFWGLARVAAGPSYFSGYKNTTDKIHNFGIGAEAEAMLKLEVIGLSLMGNMMVSPKFLYVGVTLNISAGKLN